MIVVIMQTFALGIIVRPRQMVITGDIPVKKIIRISQVPQIPSQQPAIKGKEVVVEAAVSVEMIHPSSKHIDKKNHKVKTDL